MSETLAPPNPNTSYGTDLGIASQNFVNGIYENGQPHNVEESLYNDSLFQTPTEYLDSESSQTNRESLFFKTGFAVGRLMMKGSAFIETVRANSNEAAKFSIDDLNEDMSTLRGTIRSHDKQLKALSGRDLNVFQEYAEFDGLQPVRAPKISEIDPSDRNLSITTESGEVVTESEYINRFLEDMADHPEFRDKLQWIGEKELVFAMAEQAKWLVGRVLAGEAVLVVGEDWNRKVGKSGQYISDLIVGASRKTIESKGLDAKGRIITDDEIKDDEAVNIDRAVIFEDWVLSGNDMKDRVRWAERLMNTLEASQASLSINLLSAQTELLRNGFDASKKEGTTKTIPVIAPLETLGSRGVNGAIFSGIHSDADYTFTNRPEMNDAVKSRTSNEKTSSPYGISSKDTLGSVSFYQNLEIKIQESLNASV